MKHWILILICLIGCRSTNKNTNMADTTMNFKPDYSAGPPTIVYKTRADYYYNVPVILSEDKSNIVSYPHPNDIKVDSNYQLPTRLNDGYLLDNRGITKNVAFLKLTYEEYSKLENPLSLKEMYDLIIDKDPLIELCSCGNRLVFKDLSGQLNKLIQENKLRTTCKAIK
jgi:hypothetical protein